MEHILFWNKQKLLKLHKSLSKRYVDVCVIQNHFYIIFMIIIVEFEILLYFVH